jgi:hypothetical protein
MAGNWQDAPIFYMAIPHCPWCGSQQRVKTRTRPTEADGSYTQEMVCCYCSRQYLVVHELLPSSGNHIAWPQYDDAVTSLLHRESA